MRRRVFDMLVSIGGVLMVVVLTVAGVLLLVGYNFANNNVHSQLAEQQIVFPPTAAFAHAKPGAEITPSMIPSVSQYAGQQLTTGAQAEAYANDFIGVHLQEIGGGKTYSQLSSEAMALPKGSAAYTAAEAKVQTVFQGTTLRGLLLEAYGFSVLRRNRFDRCHLCIRASRAHGIAGRLRVPPRSTDIAGRGDLPCEESSAGACPRVIPQRSPNHPARLGRVVSPLEQARRGVSIP